MRNVLVALMIALAASPCSGDTARVGPWTAGPGYRSAPLAVPQQGKTGFRSLPPGRTGVHFTNFLSEARAHENRILEDGSGVALADVNGDGRCDIYLCRLEGANALYLNQGDWRFEEAAASAGVACDGQFSTGATFADLDGDGDSDLLVNGVGVGTRCFFNDGGGRFSEGAASGLVRQYGSTSLALADTDNDGDLDLYVANYRTDTIRDAPPGVKAEFFRTAGGKVIVQPEERFQLIPKGREGVNLIERGEPDFLYRNDGHGSFTPLSWTEGAFLDEEGQPLASTPLHWGLTVVMRDFNRDGAPDIYVCNDFNFSPDQIWINDGRGAFRALPRLAMRQMSWSAMSADFADINRDGFLDFLVVEMLSREHIRRQTQRMNFRPDAMMLPFGVFDNRPEYMRNMLFLNRGDDTFAEIAQFSGLEASEWTWSVVFLDVDLDGFEDVLMANGSGHDVLDSDAGARLAELSRSGRVNRQTKVLSLFPPLETANLAFRNDGDLTFTEMGREWNFDLVGVSNAMALGDLDNDGDLDVVLNNLNDAASLYRNDTTAPRLAVRLKGLAPNTQGIGAHIRVRGGPVIQAQEMVCGSRYLSGDEAVRVFAAGKADRDLRIEVTWRSGRQSVVASAKANRLYEINEAAANPAPTAPTSAVSTENVPAATLFADASDLLNHSHHEEAFDDFARQPLLPKKLSQLGPGISWFDLDADGFDDLIIGSGRGGRVALLRNEQGRGFRGLDLAATAARDQTGILCWPRNGQSPALLFGSANYEDGAAAGPCVQQLDLQEGRWMETFPGQVSSSGPLAMADLDADGDLDLFVGGRVVPGRYPEAASSLLFRQEEGRFALDVENSSSLARVGLVSGAVFSDLDGDGWTELILACEWGPVRVYRNAKGRLSDATERLGLTRWPGWWNGVTTADFDGDGQLDVAASNWGRNSKYESHRAHGGLRLYYTASGKAAPDLIEAYFDLALRQWVPWRSLEVVAAAMPFVRERYTSYRAFGAAGAEQILGERQAQASFLEATWMESTVFLNRSNHFAAMALPWEAQLAPAFGITAADFDGDGHDDLFLSQNFFPVEMETSRYDAGRGLLLRGQGNGQFTAVPGQESGIQVYGDQRGCAAGDFDCDGRLDLAISQNSHATKLYHNRRARPGLRVRLQGPPGNPYGVGAVLRLGVHGLWGPARPMQAGGGYWSQDSAVLVLGFREWPTDVLVRWPGGQLTRSPVPAPAGAEGSLHPAEMHVDRSGAVQLKPVRP